MDRLKVKTPSLPIINYTFTYLQHWGLCLNKKDLEWRRIGKSAVKGGQIEWTLGACIVNIATDRDDKDYNLVTISSAFVCS